MLHAGSVAKGTGLRTVDDLDVAVYVRRAAMPAGDDRVLVGWLADRLDEANPNMGRDQFIEQRHTVKIEFRGSGLDVDVVPVLYDGAEDDRGDLINRRTGERVETSVSLHLQFIRARKKKYGQEYAELIRLTKWWTRQAARNNPDLRLKSFIIELIWAHLADEGTNLSDYTEALESFFVHLVKRLGQPIMFADFGPLPILHRDVDGEDRLLAVAIRGQHVVGYGRALYFTPPADAPGNVAPAGYYPLGLVVAPVHRRLGAGAALTAYRLAWLTDRTSQAWYFADIRNGASRVLHSKAGFTEVTSDFWFPAASTSSGTHVLCRMDLAGT